LQCSLSIGTLLLFTQAQEPNRDGRIIHLGKITCRTFTEFTQQEQDIIMAWLHDYYLPEHDPRGRSSALSGLLSTRGRMDGGNGRGVYFKDPNGHVLELMTVPQ
jgi:hypothetical protein